MRIAVFCSASTKIDDKYVDFAFEVGKAIAEQGWDVAWGGGTLSMMGSVSRGARSAGGKTFGVIPQKLIGKEFADEEATELFITESNRSSYVILSASTKIFIPSCIHSRVKSLLTMHMMSWSPGSVIFQLRCMHLSFQLSHQTLFKKLQMSGANRKLQKV